MYAESQKHTAEPVHGRVAAHNCTHSSSGQGDSRVAHVAVGTVNTSSRVEPLSDRDASGLDAARWCRAVD